MMRARVARFYGFEHKSISEMPYKDLVLYYKSMTHIEAEEMLNQITCSSAHTMTKKDRSDLHKRLERLKYREDIKVMSFNQFAGKLSG